MVDRTPENAHGRYDNRGPPGDYGRLDRTADAVRQREVSPGRRGGRPLPGGRTPERMPPAADHREWSGRERDYDDRALRGPPRDARAPAVRPPTWEPRDSRDARDQRERPDPRGHAAPAAMEPRRMPSTSSLANEYRRDGPPANVPYAAEQNDRPSRLPTVPIPAKEEPTVNPARAALINQAEHGRHGPPRSDRDNRGERDSRLDLPRHSDDRRGDDRRVEERPPTGYHGRNDVPREVRDERPQMPPSGGRDRREDPGSSAPTGPRGGRNEAAATSRASREMFQPTPGPRAQDPNYGRLNQPSEPPPPPPPPPSGPRSDRPHAPSQPSTPSAPTGPAASLPAGIHPSRLVNIEGRAPSGPPLQTNIPNAPSGPRNSNRTPQGPIPSSPVGPRPPTGPGGPRNAGNPLRAINNVLTGNAPADRPIERNAPPSNPPVRGRGATRANGPMEGSGGMTSPMPPPSLDSTPNRMEHQHPRGSRNDDVSSRMEGAPQEEGRSESRSHRRHDRSGRERSPDRSDRRPDERSSRTAPSDRAEGERGSDRDRGGREKRGGDRESSRRDRERDGEPRPAREPRESSRRERGSRDEGRASGGREERDRRSRGGGGGSGGDDARKRGRDPQDQGHGDTKRRR